MGKNTIKINSEKLKALCEERGEGLTIYEMPKKYGYSKNLIQGAMAKGEASIVVQNLLLNFNIRKEEYIFEEKAELKQMTIDEMQFERMNKAMEQSAKAFDALGGAICSYKNNIEKAYKTLVEEWKKAIDEYNESVKRLREGK